MDYYHPDSKVVIRVTPKAGCTTILKMFLEHCGLLEAALAYDDWVHNYRDKVFKPFPTNLTGIVRLKFVRNPFSRSVSSYLHVSRCRKDFPMFRHIQHLSFETFLEYLASSNVQWDFHFEKQFRDGEHYDDLIRIENIDERMPHINTKYGLNLKWKFDNHHHIPKQPTLITEYQGNKDFSKEFHPIGSYKQFYNKKNREMVEKIFAADFLNYGYTYDDFLNENI